MSDVEQQQPRKESHPATFTAAKWWGYVLSAIFLIYGGVKVVLSILDRNYDAMTTPIVFAAIGAIILIIAYAFRDKKKWGWMGLIGVNGLVVILAVIDFGHVENIILLVISAGALYALFAPQTKEHLSLGG